MKRRELIKLGGLALAGTAAPPLLSLKHQPTFHFVALGNRGGRILECFDRKEQSGRYTWVKDQHTNICSVDGLSKIEIRHPYSSDYFTRNRITDLPDEPLNVDLSQLSMRTDEHIVVMVEPSCYLSYRVLPEVIAHLQKAEINYHCILGLPFSFQAEMWHQATRLSIGNLGSLNAEFSILSADSVRSKKEKMKLKEAFDLLYPAYFETFLAQTQKG